MTDTQALGLHPGQAVTVSGPPAEALDSESAWVRRVEQTVCGRVYVRLVVRLRELGSDYLADPVFVEGLWKPSTARGKMEGSL